MSKVTNDCAAYLEQALASYRTWCDQIDPAAFHAGEQALMWALRHVHDEQPVPPMVLN